MKWTWLATLPTTNARIALSLLMATSTCIRVVAVGWDPSWEWLTFLTAWAGLDVLQFWAKRTTHTPASAPAGGEG